MTIKTLYILFFLLLPISLLSGNDRYDLSSFQFLKVQPTARNAALENAGTSLYGSIENLSSNPAGIFFPGQMEFSMHYMNWLHEIHYTSLAYGIRLDDSSILGFGVLGLFYGDIPVVNFNSSGELSETGNTSAYDFAFSACYHRRLTGMISSGVSLKVLYEQIEKERATGLALDTGVLIHLMDNKLNLGLAVLNIGPEIKFSGKKDDLPLSVNTGISVKLIQQKEHSGLIALDMIYPNDEKMKTRLGIEYGLMDLFFGRAGYQTGDDLSTWSIGCGLKLKIGSKVIRADYTYLPRSELNNTHIIGLVIGLN
ncbi:MAG: PorV/PorQ family protein [bacterium]|nr:PorV/PorQ family protein [bacterium]